MTGEVFHASGGAVGAWNRTTSSARSTGGDHRTNPPWSLEELDVHVPKALLADPCAAPGFFAELSSAIGRLGRARRGRRPGDPVRARSSGAGRSRLRRRRSRRRPASPDTPGPTDQPGSPGSTSRSPTGCWAVPGAGDPGIRLVHRCPRWPLPAGDPRRRRRPEPARALLDVWAAAGYVVAGADVPEDEEGRPGGQGAEERGRAYRPARRPSCSTRSSTGPQRPPHRATRCRRRGHVARSDDGVRPISHTRRDGRIRAAIVMAGVHDDFPRGVRSTSGCRCC